MNSTNNFIEFLNAKSQQYNNPSFITDDPISIPHQFTKKQDIEIAGFFAAILAWGSRKGIINSCNKLMNLMDNSPYQFICNLQEQRPSSLWPLTSFVHRTFNGTDLLYLLEFLHYHYITKGNESLETAFTRGNFSISDLNTENALNGFHQYVFSEEVGIDYPKRTKKHIAAPFKKSACKRLSMYLRWMVRKDNASVDFGLWNSIKPQQLICPLDLHVSRVARRFNLLNRTQTDWQSAVELTNYLKELDSNDPVKYDFALFGLGVIEKFV